MRNRKESFEMFTQRESNHSLKKQIMENELHDENRENESLKREKSTKQNCNLSKKILQNRSFFNGVGPWEALNQKESWFRIVQFKFITWPY